MEVFACLLVASTFGGVFVAVRGVSKPVAKQVVGFTVPQTFEVTRVVSQECVSELVIERALSSAVGANKEFTASRSLAVPRQ